VDDLADAAMFLMKHYSDEAMVNVGSGEEVTIAALARTIADIIDYQGNLLFDTSKPDGTPRKILDSSRLAAMGWRPQIPFGLGMRGALQWFTAQL
jgi:GDP-L-fucose synthase